MNTLDVDEGCSFTVVNPSVQMSLGAIIMHPHMGEGNTMHTDVMEPFMVGHHWVLVDSAVMEVHHWMEMNTLDVDEGCSFLVVNPSVQMSLGAIIMHPHMGEVNTMHTDVMEQEPVWLQTRFFL